MAITRQKFLVPSINPPSHHSLEVSPLATPDLHFTAMCQFAFSRVLRKWNRTEYTFSLWLLSLRVTTLRFIQGVALYGTPFLSVIE